MTDTGVVAATVVLVDDHPSFRRSAKRMLAAAGYDVVGEAATGADAVVVTKALDPDVVLLDVLLPDCSAFDVVDQLISSTGRPLVILISSRSAPELGPRLAASAAHGFITKSELNPSSLSESIS